MEEESNQDDISPVIVALRKYLMELSATLTDRTLITQGKKPGYRLHSAFIIMFV